MKQTLLWLTALACAVQAHAQTPVSAKATSPQDFVSALPTSGLWWEIPYTGRVYHVDVSPNGYAHVLFSYDNAGPAQARALQGQLITSTRPDALLSMGSPLYQFEAVGSAPRTTESRDGRATITFTGLEEGEVRYDGRNVRIARTQLLRNEHDSRSKRLRDRLYDYTDSEGTIPNVRLIPTERTACGSRSNTDFFKIDCTRCDLSRLGYSEIHIERTQFEVMSVVRNDQSALDLPLCEKTHTVSEVQGVIRARGLQASKASFTLKPVR
jgi:hypothetical protein